MKLVDNKAGEKIDVKIVGHRGYPEVYPENTLRGIKAAAEAGVEAIEFDIQVSRDGHPIVFHDDTLERVSGVKGSLAEYDVDVLNLMSVHEPTRFGDTYLSEPIACLENVINVLSEYPEIEIFAEVKPEIFQRFGREDFLAKLWRYLAPIKSHCTLISSDYRALKYVQKEFGWPIGWVLSDYNAMVYDDAIKLNPEFLICNIKRLPTYPDDIWSGTWEWFVYDVVDPDIARQCVERGIYFIESWDPVSLKQSLRCLMQVPSEGNIDD